MSVQRIHRATTRFRSTKSASKARRDLINYEIQNLKKMLPIHEDDQQRLSYLHAMNLSCVFIRKSVHLAVPRFPSPDVCVPSACVLPALPGFFMSFLRDGKLLYVSENVQEFLGSSMVDVLQKDSFFQLLDSEDQDKVREILQRLDPSADTITFVCHLRSSRALRIQSSSSSGSLRSQNSTLSLSVEVKGRMQNGVCVCLCSPTADRITKEAESTSCFRTEHRADMRITHAPHSVFFHLGFSADELIGKSWYELLHPEDLKHASDRHSALVRPGGEAEVQLLIRMQCKDQTCSWIYIHAAANAETHTITCWNHLVSEVEAQYHRQKLLSDDEHQFPEGDQLLCEMPRDSWISETCVDIWASDSSSEPESYSSSPYSTSSSLSSSSSPSLCSDLLSEELTAFEKLINDSQFCPTLDSSAPAVSATFPKSHLVPEPLVEPYSDSFLSPILKTSYDLLPKMIQENPFIPALESFSKPYPEACSVPVQTFFEPEPQCTPGSGHLSEPSQSFEGSFSEPLPQWFSQQPMVSGDCALNTDPTLFLMQNPGPRPFYSSPEPSHIGCLAQQIHTLAHSFHRHFPLSSTPC